VQHGVFKITLLHLVQPSGITSFLSLGGLKSEVSDKWASRKPTTNKHESNLREPSRLYTTRPQFFHPLSNTTLFKHHASRYILKSSAVINFKGAFLSVSFLLQSQVRPSATPVPRRRIMAEDSSAQGILRYLKVSVTHTGCEN
jgi:hypothetical protein